MRFRFRVGFEERKLNAQGRHMRRLRRERREKLRVRNEVYLRARRRRGL